MCSPGASEEVLAVEAESLADVETDTLPEVDADALWLSDGALTVLPQAARPRVAARLRDRTAIVFSLRFLFSGTTPRFVGVPRGVVV